MRTELQSIQISNLRSLTMSEQISLSPITILIGKNSAGKSTFARTFPLIRQSCEAKKRAPILWFGDRVDFGSFDESLRKSASSDSEISFTFGLRHSRDRRSTWTLFLNDEHSYEDFYSSKIEIRIKKAQNHPSQASRVIINALGFNVDIKLSDSRFVEHIRCGELSWTPEPGQLTDVTYSSLLPRLSFYKQVEDPKHSSRYTEFKPCEDLIKQKISKSRFLDHADFLYEMIAAAPIVERGELCNYIDARLPFYQLKKKINSDKLKNFINEIEAQTVILRINSFLEIFDTAINEYFSGVKYIEPLRATAQRYYRKQELAIDEIDSKGENLAMFLDSIDRYRLNNFNRWTLDNFGFSARTSNEGGHVTILIKERDSESESNLADIGFGFSQILPVITQVWLSTSRMFTKSKDTTCIVVEQPELHLHPSFQAKLADVFVAAATDARTKGQRMIIETHSNHIVNRVGQLINEGKLESSSVQILIFEKDDVCGTAIRLAGYNEKGYLRNWPIGFFEPGVE